MIAKADTTLDTLESLRQECEPRQQLFAQIVQSGMVQYKAYTQAGYESKSDKVARTVSSELMARPNVKAYFNALMAYKQELSLRVSNMTRNSQLQDLELAKDLAIAKKDSKGLTTACKEQSAMKGWHTELAPNSEKEALRNQLSEAETLELQAFANQRMLDKAKSIDSKVLERTEE